MMNRRDFGKVCAALGITAALPNFTSDRWQHWAKILKPEDKTISTQIKGGEISQFAYWDVALSDDEIAQLAKGVDPRFIRPDSLQYYLPGHTTNEEKPK